MVPRTILGVFGAAVMVAVMSAQAPAQPPKGIAVDRGRPTQHDDPLPVFDFAYFIGTWSFEWDVPEGPMGAAGTITGKTVYRAIGAQTYEAATTATGPDGPFTIDKLKASLNEVEALLLADLELEEAYLGVQRAARRAQIKSAYVAMRAFVEKRVPYLENALKR